MREHLVQRGTSFYIRRRVPLELVEFVKRREIQTSLGTSDRRKAAELCRARSAALDAVFSAAREDIPTPSASTREATNLLGVSPGEYWLGQMLAASSGGTGVHKYLALPTQPAARNSPTARDLDSLIKRWAKERTPTTATLATMTRAVDRFRKLVGDMPVTAIKKTHVVAFKDKLLQTYTEANTNYNLTQITVLCGFAAAQGWIETNPALGVKLKLQDDGAARLAFNEQQLSAIFNSPVYTEGFRPGAGAGESAYWLPLLGLFTGARVEELCQLSPKDVKQDTYRDDKGKAEKVWVFLITNEGEGQRLKNSGSLRRLPIHAELLKRGFIKFVESRKGEARIFPVTVSPSGRHAANWSLWWHKYQRETVGIKDKRYVFHSFRHTFKDVCRELGIDKGIRDAIQGHAEKGAAGGYGGEFYPLRPLVEAMAKYKVTGVQLPR